MKKIFLIIPFVMFVIIFIWGFTKINIENTEVFNNKNQEVTNVDYEKIKEDTGMDLTIFSKDNSIIKIYKEGSNLTLVINDIILELSNNILGKIFISILDIFDNSIDKINNLINIIFMKLE